MTKRSRRSKRSGRIAHGLLLIDKAKGCSSFDVIRDLRRQTHVNKMGHTGTLDPMATGLMVICVGEGTKLVPYLTADDKTYIAEVTFGVATDSYDAEGEVTARNMAEELGHLDLKSIEIALESFLGPQTQTPPAFSAIRVNGERLYKKARRGEVVHVPSRDVVFHRLDLSSFTPQGEDSLPRVRFTVKCSKGTYIRSLASDLGKALGVHAHLTELRRTAAGLFTINDASMVTAVTSERLEAKLMPLVNALPQHPLITLTPTELTMVKQGRSIKRSQRPSSEIGTIYRAQDELGHLIALLRNDQDGFKVLRGFNEHQSPESLKAT